MKTQNTLVTLSIIVSLGCGLVGCGLVGCGASAPAAETAPATSAATEVVTEAVADPVANAIPEAAVLLATTGEFDAESGADTVTLYADGTLAVGTLRGAVELTEATDYFMGEQAAVRIHRYDDAKNAIMVALPTSDQEDPPNRYQLFVQQGDALVKIFDQVIGVYGVHDPEIRSNDGSLVIDEDPHSACARANPETMTETRPPMMRHTWRPNADGQLELAESVEMDRVAHCDQLPACPFVYLVANDGSETFMGEILRNVVGRDAYQAQTLAVDGLSAERVRITMREEKAEITYLDEVHLVVDGVAISPRACDDSATAPRYCAADHQAHVMNEGDELVLEFDAPAGSRELSATGFYIPRHD